MTRPELLAAGHVDRGRRLVEEGHLRLAGQGQREGQPLALAAGELPPGRPSTRGEPDETEELAGVAAPAVEIAEQADRLGHPDARVDAAVLEHDAHPLRERPVVGDRIEAEHPHRAAVGAPVALEHLDGGGLARAVGPEQGRDGAGLGREAHAVDGHEVAVAHDERVDLDGGHGRRGYWCRYGAPGAADAHYRRSA